MRINPLVVRRGDHRLFAIVAGIALLLVLCGFARTYFLRPWLGLPSLTTFLHVHAAVMLSWVTLLSVQVYLIGQKQFVWHRRLGVVGMGLAAMVVIMGTSATWRAAVREVGGHTVDARVQLTVLGLELTQMILFATFASLGFLWRRRPDFHKRLMVMATVAILPNPIVRILVFLQIHSINMTTVVILDILVLAIIVVDATRNRRFHPAFIWGAVAVLGGLHIALVLAPSDMWHTFATRLIVS